MYLISRYTNLQLPIRDRKVEYHPKTGEVVNVKPAITLSFEHGGKAPDWARAAASQLPGFGQGMAMDEDPFTRIGVFDTADADWSDEDRAFVEEILQRIQGDSFVIVEAPRAGKPWPTYDSMTDVDEIVYTLDHIGADPGSVLRYERENANRAEVVAELERRVEGGDEDVEAVVGA